MAKISYSPTDIHVWKHLFMHIPIQTVLIFESILHCIQLNKIPSPNIKSCLDHKKIPFKFMQIKIWLQHLKKQSICLCSFKFQYKSRHTLVLRQRVPWGQHVCNEKVAKGTLSYHSWDNCWAAFYKTISSRAATSANHVTLDRRTARHWTTVVSSILFIYLFIIFECSQHHPWWQLCFFSVVVELSGYVHTPATWLGFVVLTD